MSFPRPPLSTSSMPVSLPSIHEMFPDHLMRKDAHHCPDRERPHSHSGYPYPESPGVHHPQYRHPVSGVDSPCGCRSVSHAVYPPSRHNLPTNAEIAQTQDHRLYESPVDEKHHPAVNSSQNIYGFNSLRSSPALSSLQHITAAGTPPHRPVNPPQIAHSSVVGSGSSPAFRVSAPPPSLHNERHEGQEARHRREAFPPYVSSPEGRYAAVSSPGTRAPAGIDPYPAIISFPISRPGPLPPSSSKYHQHYPNNPNNLPGRGPGTQEYEEKYASRGPFLSSSGINGHGLDPNEEEDDGAASGADDNDTSNGKKHVCPTCFKRFNRPSSLRIHVNTHTGATPFRCPWPNCGREFNVNSNMRRHYRNHTTPGFSRSQNGSNSNTANAHLNDGRRKRRRASAPQVPPTSATSPTPGPPSNPYPLSHAPYRTEHHYRHPPASNHDSRSPHASNHAHHGPPNHLHGSQFHPQQGPFTNSPPISSLSLSDDDSSSGSDSDVDEDRYPALRSSMNSKKEIDDDLLEYEPDSSSLGYRTASLTQSLARVTVASNNVSSRRGHPYGLYSPTYHASAHGANGHDAPRRRPDHGYGHPNGYSDPDRPLTPGSSFHSSSPSPSISPSPPPSATMPSNSPNHSNAKSSYKYSASTPYVRSLADSWVSTTLRPAFGNSSERERDW